MATVSAPAAGLPAFLNSRGFGVLLVAILVFGMFAPVLYDVDEMATMLLAVKFLGLPILALCCYGFVSMTRPKSVGDRFFIIFLALVFSLLLLRASVGYLVLLNALGPWQGEAVVQGHVVELGRTGYKVRRDEVVIVDAAGHRRSLAIGYDEYSQLSVGQAYSARWKRGTLGILYK